MSESKHEVFITVSMEVQVTVSGCSSAEDALKAAKDNLDVVDLCNGIEVEFEDISSWRRSDEPFGGSDSETPVEFEVQGAHGWFEDTKGNSYAN
tara:strand:- start:154 stop:435 length:282 start_codon:yes stop_codon:yes gene_type:complete